VELARRLLSPRQHKYWHVTSLNQRRQLSGALSGSTPAGHPNRIVLSGEPFRGLGSPAKENRPESYSIQHSGAE
jgi:hypothetical protein